MAAFLQFRPVLMGACVGADELELILSCVVIQEHPSPTTGNASTNDDADDDAMATTILISDIQKDAVSILGMLSSQPHPHEVNVKMCTALVALLYRSTSSSSTSSSSSSSSSSPTTTTAHVMNEVLNVLMDMYSADAGDPNNHADVFQAMCVLGVFQKCAPIFKRKIRQEEMNDGGGGGSMEDCSMWKETALNVTRFVRYKKGR